MSWRSYRAPAVLGHCRFESRIFSNRWRLLQGEMVLAELTRFPTRHISVMSLPDGSEQELRPDGWGTVVARQNGTELGRITRASWWGRTWEVATPGFACALTCDPRPRHWSLRFGSEPFASLNGTLFSYNRLQVDTAVAVPISALALVWHVLARSWELAAAPGQLIPAGGSYRLITNRG